MCAVSHSLLYLTGLGGIVDERGEVGAHDQAGQYAQPAQPQLLLLFGQHPKGVHRRWEKQPNPQCYSDAPIDFSPEDGCVRVVARAYQV